MLAEPLALGEPLIVFAGLGGFILAGLVMRWRSRRAADDPALQSMMLHALLAGPVGP